MPIFSEDEIKIAELEDAANITHLLNKAYRGEEAKKGWTTESDIIAGNQRTILEEVQQLINKEKSYFLIYKEEDTIIGCVNAQIKDEGLYVGMLSVEPSSQNSGIGKKLLHAAEELADVNNCTCCYMTVIDIRKELIDFYQRIGYADTHERIPFEEDGVSGKHLQPLQFMVMKKNLV